MPVQSASQNNGIAHRNKRVRITAWRSAAKCWRQNDTSKLQDAAGMGKTKPLRILSAAAPGYVDELQFIPSLKY